MRRSRWSGRAWLGLGFLGAVVLLVVAVLTGLVPGREALVAARQPQRVQTQTAGDLRVTLTLSSLQPEETTFDVLLRVGRTGQPVADAERVAVRIVMLTMEMGEAEVLAAPVGGGHYQARGAYLPMSGRWQLRVLVRRTTHDDVDTAFPLEIGPASAAPSRPGLPALPRPSLTDLTLPQRAGVVLLAAGAGIAALALRILPRARPVSIGLGVLAPLVFGAGVYLLASGGAPAVAPARANPVLPNTASVARGRDLYTTNCVSCHGPGGHGDGPAAASLPAPLSDLADGHLAPRGDDVLFDALSGGTHAVGQPGLAALSDNDRWDLVNYLRTLPPAPR